MKLRCLRFAVGAVASQATGLACELCEAQQPKLFRGLTHGGGPQGNFDYVIVAITAVIVLFAFVYAIKCVCRPGEQDANHIKRIILIEDGHGI
ncbi:MAG: hypothetical protein ABI273_04860 [Lacunisphaera sp.]